MYTNLIQLKYSYCMRLATFFFFLCVISIPQLSYSQTELSGRVIDSSTGKGIPYVNIGIVELKLGTMSKDDGSFRLSLTDEYSGHNILFSSVGYDSKEVQFGDFDAGMTVELNPSEVLLDSIVIEGKGKIKDEYFGHRIEKTRGGIGLGDWEPGDEIAARIDINKSVYIKEVNFVIDQALGDSMKFRLNIYEVLGGKPGKNLIPRNVFIHDKIKEGVYTVDVSGLNLVVEDDIFLALEYLIVDQKENYAGILFRFDANRKGNMYSRKGPDSKNARGPFSLFPNARLAFFVTGQSIGE